MTIEADKLQIGLNIRNADYLASVEECPIKRKRLESLKYSYIGLYEQKTGESYHLESLRELRNGR